MDRMYALQRHLYDATRKYYLLGRDQLIDRLDPPAGGTVIEIGCGTARNLITAARRWPNAHFYGVDIATTMLETARAHVARAGLTDRITLGQGERDRFRSRGALRYRAVRPRIPKLYPVDDPRLARRDRSCRVASGARRPVVDRRLRAAGRVAAVVARVPARLARAVACHAAVDLFDSASTIAQERHLTRRFAVQHRGYAWSVVLERPFTS